MFKLKVFTSILIFSSLLIITSTIKNQTREIEKKIYKMNNKIHLKKKDLNESQLDFYYLTSPSMIEKSIEHLDTEQYFPMKHSKIFLSISDYLEIENKLAIKNKNEKEKKKKQKF
tara:strand:- start:742 stop:1086 length:345 start_codon:yes stop_codon:yes gene_type:complete